VHTNEIHNRPISAYQFLCQITKYIFDKYLQCTNCRCLSSQPLHSGLALSQHSGQHRCTQAQLESCSPPDVYDQLLRGSGPKWMVVLSAHLLLSHGRMVQERQLVPINSTIHHFSINHVSFQYSFFFVSKYHFTWKCSYNEITKCGEKGCIRLYIIIELFPHPGHKVGSPSIKVASQDVLQK
jgi:hypothetical protein